MILDGRIKNRTMAYQRVVKNPEILQWKRLKILNKFRCQMKNEEEANGSRDKRLQSANISYV